MQQFNLPKYSKVVYQLQAETKYFIQNEIEAQPTPIARLPLELRIAPAKASNVAPNAALLLLSRECNKGKYKFITGIQQTCFPNWFVGNDYEFQNGQKVMSLILFHLSDSEQRLEVYYFYRYDKSNAYLRLKFADTFIPNLKRGAA